MALHVTFTTAYLNNTYTITLYHPFHRTFRSQRPRTLSKKKTNEKRKLGSLENTSTKNQLTSKQLHKSQKAASRQSKKGDVTKPKVVVYNEGGNSENSIECQSPSRNVLQRDAKAARTVGPMNIDPSLSVKGASRQCKQIGSKKGAKNTKKKKKEAKDANVGTAADLKCLDAEDNSQESKVVDMSKKKRRPRALIRSLSEKSFAQLSRARRALDRK